MWVQVLYLFRHSARVARTEHKAATKMKLAPTTTAVATFYVRNSRTQIILRFTKKGELDMCDYSLHGIENRLAEDWAT